METPSIWLGISNQILGLWIGFRVAFEGRIWSPLGTKEGWDFESHPPGVWWDTKQPTTNSFGSFHWHSNFWEESRSYLSRTLLFLLYFLDILRICEAIPWVLGIAPILSGVRICRPSLGSERQKGKGGAYCLTYLWGRTHPSLESERHFQCYLTREDKHVSRPGKSCGFHWWEAKSRETSPRKARPMDVSRRIRASVLRGTLF